jgi:hypothetical protein
MIKIFIQSYNEKTFLEAKKFFPFSWAVPILVPNATENNPYFENKFFVDFLSIVDQSTLESVDFIGCLSYKAHKKIDLKFLDNYIKLFGTSQDFIHFFCIPGQTVLHSHLNGGKYFTSLWNDCCLDDIGELDKTQSCFSNYWMAKKPYFLNYCTFLKDFADRIYNHPLGMENGKYFNGKLSKENLIKLCGKPYYPILPFLIERCTIGYFMTLGFQEVRRKNGFLCLSLKDNLDNVDNFEGGEVIPALTILDYTKANPASEKKLILYLFHEMNVNVDYFLKHGIYEKDDTDFVIIVNDLNIQLDHYNLKEKKNVYFLYRENYGFDFGGWYDGLKFEERWKNYNYFMFLNSSVIGPFSSTPWTEHWAEHFFNDFNEFPFLGISGTTINFTHGLHVQSMTFALKFGFLEYLLNTNQIFYHPLTKDEAIQNCEIKLSKICLTLNLGIKTKMEFYNRQLLQPKIIYLKTLLKKRKGNINSSSKEILKFIKNKYELIFVKNKFYNGSKNSIDVEFTKQLCEN